jgi:hypothetical protein
MSRAEVAGHTVPLDASRPGSWAQRSGDTGALEDAGRRISACALDALRIDEVKVDIVVELQPE